MPVLRPKLNEDWLPQTLSQTIQKNSFRICQSNKYVLLFCLDLWVPQTFLICHFWLSSTVASCGYFLSLNWLPPQPPYQDSARLFTKLSIVPPKGIVRLQLNITAPTLNIWSFSLIANCYQFCAPYLKVSHQGLGCYSGIPSSAVNTSALGSNLLN